MGPRDESLVNNLNMYPTNENTASSSTAEPAAVSVHVASMLTTILVLSCSEAPAHAFYSGTEYMR
jgi:hypothetical protein